MNRHTYLPPARARTEENIIARSVISSFSPNRVFFSYATAVGPVFAPATTRKTIRFEHCVSFCRTGWAIGGWECGVGVCCTRRTLTRFAKHYLHIRCAVWCVFVFAKFVCVCVCARVCTFSAGLQIVDKSLDGETMWVRMFVCVCVSVWLRIAEKQCKHCAMVTWGGGGKGGWHCNHK